MPGVPKYDNFMDAIRKIYTASGVRGFYRGVIPTLIKVVPSTAVSYAVYGTMKDGLTNRISTPKT
jgi:hypothetical protein